MSKADRINACRAVRRSTGHMQVYPQGPSAELEAFAREHRAWRVVPLLCVLVAALVLGGLALAGCAHLGALGRAMQDGGEVMQRQAHPGVALAGVFVTLAGAAVAALGKKYEKPLVTSAGIVGATFGIGTAGVQNAPMLGGAEQPPAHTAPAEPGQ